MRMQLLILGVLGVAAAGSASAQAISGTAYAARVTMPNGTSSRGPSVVLDPATGMSEAADDSFSVPGAMSSKVATALTTGATGSGRGGAQSVATLADVSVLNGLIRASRVYAIASTTGNSASRASNALGSSFEGLVVAGQTVATDGAVAPNTRMTLPGVGYVVLNEQIQSAGGITVNMIHVVLQNALTGAKTGEIIVGSASSAVN